MLATLSGDICLLFGLALLLLPLLAVELSRPRDGVWGAVVLILGLVLVTSSDRMRGAPMLAVLCGSLLISRLSAEVGQSRWRALSDEEQTKLGSADHWRNNLQQLGSAMASLGEGLTGIVKQLKPAGKSGVTLKKWVRPELEASNAADAEPGPTTPSEGQSEETPETTPATSAPESEGEA